MKKLQTITRTIGIKVMEAGVLFMAVAAMPGQALAQQSPLQTGIDNAKPTNAEENLFEDGGIFQTVANILLLVLGAIAVIMLIIGGFRYVVSGGDSGAVEGAKNTILYAIIGIVVAFLAYAAVNFVIGSLGAGGTSF